MVKTSQEKWYRLKRKRVVSFQAPIDNWQNVKLVRTQISVSGFTRQEVEGGLQELLEEFGRRPWLLNARVWWDSDRTRLVVSIEHEGDSLASQDSDTVATLDEVSDCVIASITFESEIRFDVESTTFVQPA